MPSGDHPLTHFERGQIHAGWHRGLSKREIARPLERDPTTMARETPRHCGQRGDRHQPAQGKATSRHRAASAVPWKMTPERWAMVEHRLQAGWSPEPISGRFQQPGQGMAGREWIDQSTRADRKAGGGLYECLRRRGKQPNGRRGRPAGRGHLPGRVDIAERPLIGEAKGRIGDWELDLIIGVMQRVHTGTTDNGKEFAGHREIAVALGTDLDFATPYHSWERGLDEQTHGRVRQSFPKGTDFRQVTASQVQALEERINRRPRKVLGYRTPAEVFADAWRRLRRRSFLPHLPPFQKPVFDGPGPARPKPA